MGLLGVYSVATGATLSAGFFLLPGIAFQQAGPAMVLSYMLAVIPLIPATFSIVELATAMPRAGGVYYFIDRAMGPLVGTIGGLGTWLALVLKISFALVGMGAYIQIFAGDGAPLTAIAVGIAVALGGLNLFSAKNTAGLQTFLVGGLLAALVYFLAAGVPATDVSRLQGMFSSDWNTTISTAGMVYISYVGVTKVASLSEEVRDPERNLPLGVFLSLATAVVVYLVGSIVLVGTLAPAKLANSLHPVADAAHVFGGKAGMIIVTIAALMAFVSVANAGLLSASRYPLAMSRDAILPPIFQRISKRGIPVPAVIATVGAIVLILLCFDATKIAKLASAFQLLMFGFVCFAVIVMRESKIDSYDPGYKSPWYPYMQIFGMIAPIILIVLMGWLPSLFAAGLVAIGAMWYRHVAPEQLERSGAVYHVFERLGRLRREGLDTELREILKEKGLRSEDPFDDIVARSFVVDFEEHCTFEDVIRAAAPWIADHLGVPADEVSARVLAGTRIGQTPVARQVALPHFRSSRVEQPELVLARGRKGITLTHTPPGAEREITEDVFAVIFLLSPRENPTQHLRILAQVARHVEDKDFPEDWDAAVDDQELKEVLLREERWLSLFIHHGAKTEKLIGKALRDIEFPDGSLVAMYQRGGEIHVPRGGTVLEAGDRLTIIGEPDAVEATYELYFGRIK
jgi:amino acid transporter/mannitol/fructose-specific phosphotransferase system IIA component (Ntr-type)